jgi:hypothetical protein
VIERMSAGPVVADTFAGRIHVEWDNSATVTPLGQLPFFIEFVKQGSLFDSCVADCPLHYRSPNAPNKRDVLGTVLRPCPSKTPPRLMARTISSMQATALRAALQRRASICAMVCNENGTDNDQQIG